MSAKKVNQKSTLFFLNTEGEPLLSKKNRKLLSDPLDDNKERREGCRGTSRKEKYRKKTGYTI
jgi:hypothetical protein